MLFANALNIENTAKVQTLVFQTYFTCSCLEEALIYGSYGLVLHIPPNYCVLGNKKMIKCGEKKSGICVKEIVE